jgi:hypothetical protein
VTSAPGGVKFDIILVLNVMVMSTFTRQADHRERGTSAKCFTAILVGPSTSVIVGAIEVCRSGGLRRPCDAEVADRRLGIVDEFAVNDCMSAASVSWFRQAPAMEDIETDRKSNDVKKERIMTRALHVSPSQSPSLADRLLDRREKALLMGLEEHAERLLNLAWAAYDRGWCGENECSTGSRSAQFRHSA